MSVSNTQVNLLHSPKNIILYQCNGLGKYIVELVCIGTTNTNMPPCLCQDMWREPCMNINTKGQHVYRIHHTNGKYQIMGLKLNVQTMIMTNLSYHQKTEKIYKRWQENFSIMKQQLTPPYQQIQAHQWRHNQKEQNTPKM